MLKKLLIPLLFMLQMPLNAYVIILNGTGSAGKSSLARALSETLDGNVVVISHDSILTELMNREAVNKHGLRSRSQLGKKLWDELYDGICCSQAYDIIIKMIHAYKECETYLIVDVVIDSEELNTRFKEALSKEHCFNVTVYCSPARLVEHVEKRNKLKNRDELRSVETPLDIYFDMYRVAQPGQPALVLDRKETVEAFKKAKAMLTGFWNKKELEFLKALEEDFMNAFELHEPVEKVHVTPRFGCDFIIDAGLKSPQACAQETQAALKRWRLPQVKRIAVVDDLIEGALSFL